MHACVYVVLGGQMLLYGSGAAPEVNGKSAQVRRGVPSLQMPRTHTMTGEASLAGALPQVLVVAEKKNAIDDIKVRLPSEQLRQ